MIPAAKPLCLICLALGIFATASFCQAATAPQASGSQAGSASPAAPATGSRVARDALPPGYSASKENAFRRYEIITIGSYPIMLFYVGFVADVKRYADNNYDSSYLPWPFSTSTSTSITDTERFSRMEIAAGLSLAVATADAVIRAIQDAKALSDAKARVFVPPDGEAGRPPEAPSAPTAQGSPVDAAPASTP